MSADLFDSKAVAVDSGSLGVFPEEIWEAILNYLSDSKDVKNVFLAFPTLDKSFHNKKSDWLFGLVLPHLMTRHLTIKIFKDTGMDRKFTQSKELLNLRLVSKRWKNCVDRALQNKANQCPSLSLADQTSKPNVNHFNFLPMSEFRLGMTIFQNAEQVDKFMEDMLDHQGNPFPGKSVCIQPQRPVGYHSETLIEKCVELFETFGKQVDVLDMTFYDRENQCHLNMSNNILKCLSNLPNLRSLSFNGEFEGQRGDDDSRTDENTTKLFEKPGSQKLYPKLPNLETFIWRVLVTHSLKESAWAIGMIKAYGKGEQLCKIGIEENLYWTTVKSSSLTNLTELNLFWNICFEPNLPKLEKVLRSLPCGQKLRKFSLKAIYPSMKDYKVNLYKLINILAGFKVESLALDVLHLEEGRNFEGDSEMAIMCPAKTITSLFVGDNLELSYDFLRLLPNLRFLTVHQNKRVRQESCVELQKGTLDQEAFSTILRKAILKGSAKGLGVSDLKVIWEKLPKLEMIRGSVEVFPILREHDYDPSGFNLNVQYVRECGNQAFLRWTPEWKKEKLFIHREDNVGADDVDEDDYVNEDDYVDENYDMDEENWN